jgi:hypothetical protein
LNLAELTNEKEVAMRADDDEKNGNDMMIYLDWWLSDKIRRNPRIQIFPLLKHQDISEYVLIISKYCLL